MAASFAPGYFHRWHSKSRVILSRTVSMGRTLPASADSPYAAVMAAPAGWYDDPEMANTRRYWDGSTWTEHRQEKPRPPAVAVDADAPSSAAAGWGMAFAILLPIVGFFVGLALLGKRGNDGIKIVVVSVGCFFVWLWIFSSVAQENAADACRSENIYREGTGLPQLTCG